MDLLPKEVLRIIFENVPYSQLDVLRNVSTLWRSTVDEYIVIKATPTLDLNQLVEELSPENITEKEIILNTQRDDQLKRVYFDGFTLKDFVNLTKLEIKSVDDDNYDDNKYSSFGIGLLAPGSINRIQFFPKSIRILILETVFLKSYHLNFILRELKNLQDLKLSRIGEQNCFGIFPSWINELEKGRRLNKLSVFYSLNQPAWTNQNLLFRIGAVGTSYPTRFPLINAIRAANIKYKTHFDLEMTLTTYGYKVKCEEIPRFE